MGDRKAVSLHEYDKEHGKMEKRKLLDFRHWSCNLPNMISKFARENLRAV